jgi:hypothetical protein
MLMPELGVFNFYNVLVIAISRKLDSFFGAELAKQIKRALSIPGSVYTPKGLALRIKWAMKHRTEPLDFSPTPPRRQSFCSPGQMGSS